MSLEKVMRSLSFLSLMERFGKHLLRIILGITEPLWKRGGWKKKSRVYNTCTKMMYSYM